MPEVEELPGAAAPLPGWLLRAAAAVETAVPASLAVLAWFAVHSLLLREPWWSKFNVAAAPFFGDRVYFLGLGRATLAGAALLFVLYSVLGILSGFLAGGRGTARSLLLAALWLACWHLFSQQYIWPRLDPAAPPYFPLSATAPAHAAAAIFLARYPAVFRRLCALGQSVAPAAVPGPVLAEPEAPRGGGIQPAGKNDETPFPQAGADC